MFKLLGVLLGVYVVYAAMTGEVIAKSGPGMRRVDREESSRYFWTVIAIYASLALSMILWF